MTGAAEDITIPLIPRAVESLFAERDRDQDARDAGNDAFNDFGFDEVILDLAASKRTFVTLASISVH